MFTYVATYNYHYQPTYNTLDIKTLNGVTHLNRPPIWDSCPFKLNNNVKNIILRSTMNEHFCFKVKGLVGWVQIRAPLLIA
jgi:hypothetical protein